MAASLSSIIPSLIGANWTKGSGMLSWWRLGWDNFCLCFMNDWMKHVNRMFNWKWMCTNECLGRTDKIVIEFGWMSSNYYLKVQTNAVELFSPNAVLLPKDCPKTFKISQNNFIMFLLSLQVSQAPPQAVQQYPLCEQAAVILLMLMHDISNRCFSNSIGASGVLLTSHTTCNSSFQPFWNSATLSWSSICSLRILTSVCVLRILTYPWGW